MCWEICLMIVSDGEQFIAKLVHGCFNISSEVVDGLTLPSGESENILRGYINGKSML